MPGVPGNPTPAAAAWTPNTSPRKGRGSHRPGDPALIHGHNGTSVPRRTRVKTTKGTGDIDYWPAARRCLAALDRQADVVPRPLASCWRTSSMSNPDAVTGEPAGARGGLAQ